MNPNMPSAYNNVKVHLSYVELITIIKDSEDKVRNAQAKHHPNGHNHGVAPKDILDTKSKWSKGLMSESKGSLVQYALKLCWRWVRG